jgi:hypothetical protein
LSHLVFFMKELLVHNPQGGQHPNEPSEKNIG